MFAGELAALKVERVAVGIVGRRAEYTDVTVVLAPAPVRARPPFLRVLLAILELAPRVLFELSRLVAFLVGLDVSLVHFRLLSLR